MGRSSLRHPCWYKRRSRPCKWARSHYSSPSIYCPAKGSLGCASDTWVEKLSSFPCYMSYKGCHAFAGRSRNLVRSQSRESMSPRAALMLSRRLERAEGADSGRESMAPNGKATQVNDVHQASRVTGALTASPGGGGIVGRVPGLTSRASNTAFLTSAIF
jgi:hypothetical protein